ncbi:hypothetical protein YTPLAS18_28560 [Nitrospira sp.]|nr:hypothetical protein YTPLAS18_28560 [Nitrospira sp.]
MTIHGSPARPLGALLLVLLTLVSTGCSGRLYGWEVRTNSTPLSSSYHLATLGQDKMAVLTPMSTPSLRGTEVGMGYYLGAVLHKVAPTWHIVDERESVTLINTHGLVEEYARMRTDAELTNILDRHRLQKIGAAVGARYVLQLRLAHFSEDLQDRWSFPALNIRVVQTRSSILRLALQLWDTTNGELIWSSTAEATLENETMDQDPIFLGDAARVTLASSIADLLNRKTASRYTPLNQFLDNLMREAIPEVETK